MHGNFRVVFLPLLPIYTQALGGWELSYSNCPASVVRHRHLIDGNFHIVILPLLLSSTQALDGWELSYSNSPAPAVQHTGA